MKRFAKPLCLLPGLLLAGSLYAESWGDLHGQFVYDGEPPVPAKLEITKDEEECCQHQLVDESLLVDSQTRGVKNVVVYLVLRRGQEVPVHSSYTALEHREQKLDNLACRFDPRVVLLWKSQTLLIGNADPIGHNAMIDTRKNAPVNVTIPTGGIYKHRFPNEEPVPVAVSCSLHPWMRGSLVIRNTPYMAVTGKEGRFAIQNLPTGHWDFVFWHERASYLTEVVRNGQPVQWKRGRTELVIRPGKNDMGVVTVKPSQFDR